MKKLQSGSQNYNDEQIVPRRRTEYLRVRRLSTRFVIARSASVAVKARRSLLKDLIRVANAPLTASDFALDRCASGTRL